MSEAQKEGVIQEDSLQIPEQREINLLPTFQDWMVSYLYRQ